MRKHLKNMFIVAGITTCFATYSLADSFVALKYNDKPHIGGINSWNSGQLTSQGFNSQVPIGMSLSGKPYVTCATPQFNAPANINTQPLIGGHNSQICQSLAAYIGYGGSSVQGTVSASGEIDYYTYCYFPNPQGGSYSFLCGYKKN